MKDGILAASGPPRQVVNAATIRDVFGVAAGVINDPVDGTPFCLATPRRMSQDRAPLWN
ncbi:hypothetical protein [Ancylobacter sp. FA202]|uniref:hypothetical protein n=1 Tax=Ancylobacter sp. FA202 TaxID=1111106 RepID=UPI00037ED657|nr:hypothetical protein [Ancylobacter sp. FA202]